MKSLSVRKTGYVMGLILEIIRGGDRGGNWGGDCSEGGNHEK